MSKKNKKDKELDIILEQLKKSYGNESSDTAEERPYESYDEEEDVELSTFLSKLFSEEQEMIESKNDDCSKSSNELEYEIKEPEIIIEDVTDDEIVEPEILVENVIEDEIVEPEILVEDITEDEEFYPLEKLNDFSIDPDDIESSDIIEPEFAVEDEEYEILPYSASEDYGSSFDPTNIIDSSIDNETDELFKEPCNESFEEIHEEGCEKTPLIVLDPDQYTRDPLQNSLPKFKTLTKSSEPLMAASTLIEETSPVETEDFDDNDVSLLLKFGYDDEIKLKAGEEKTRSVNLEIDRKFVSEDNSNPYGFCGEDLTDRNQIPKIKQKYSVQKRSLLITLASIFILFLMTLSVTIYFDTYSSRTNSFPILLLMEFILVVIIAAILYKKLLVGIGGIIKLLPDQYSILSFILAVYVLYDVCALVNYIITYESVNPSELALLGSCVALYALIIVAADLVSCIKEASAFELIASSDKLFTAEKAGKDYHLDPTHSEETTYRIRKASLISGYFKKTSQRRPPVVNLIYFLGVVPLIALIIGCVFAICGGSIMCGISSATISTMLCLPLSCICIFSFNEYIISKKLKVDKIAVIGYDAISEYSKIQNLTFDDSDVMLITSYSEIHPQTAHGQNTLKIAYEIFDTLNGTISEYLSTDRNGKSAQSPNIVINSISDNGIDVNYTSSTNVLFGDKSYMRAHNIKVKTDSSLYGATKGSGRSVLYMAFDGVPKLGFILGSFIVPDFIKVARELESHGVKVFVDSCEPHVNDLYFEQNTEGNLSVGVLKPQAHNPHTYDSIRDGNVICASNAFCLAKIIPISKRIIRQRSICRYINCGLIISGFVLSGLLAFAISSRADLAFFEFIKLHCSLIINLILTMGLVPGLIALLHFQKDEGNTTPITKQNGEKKPK